MSDGQTKTSFLDQLRRRKVVRAAVVYGATAFATLEAADLIVPRLGLPDWTVTWVSMPWPCWTDATRPPSG